jgi:hypothetical protein
MSLPVPGFGGEVEVFVSIDFHCPYCGVSIKAPENTGGKKGRCPKCNQAVYIPMPGSEGEAFDLIPLDHEHERHQSEMMDESFATRLDLLASDEFDESSESTKAYLTVKTRDVPRLVHRYLLAMANANLPRAERIEEALKGHKRATLNYVEKLTVLKRLPSEFKSFPEPLIRGFLKKLTEEL